MSKPHILMPGRMMDLVVQRLDDAFTLHKLWEAEDQEAAIAAVADKVEGIATGGHRRVDGDFMSRFPNLKIVSNFGVGYDTVDAAWAGKHGIYVTNTPDVLTDEVADTTLGLLLMTVRQLSETERYLRAGRWEKEGAFPLTQNTLRERKVGILGLGRIGKAIAHRLEAFGSPIAYHGRNKQSDVPYRYYDNLVEMARDVDILISVAPGGASTHHLISTDVFNALGPQGVLINVGRGSVVDEQALIAALKEERLFSAGLDVFEHEPKVPAELMAMERVVLLPHVGSASIHTRNLMGQLVVDNITSFFEKGKPLTPVAETPVS
ncbi:2-hydroxyacid dehydrogenase [Aquibaculum arenosum]|uniref:2-hydroxyacid dehydrogenase n=1 Tax=Aquibaculum arenosum TaxID=3032591 RepID=A0ABT5YIW6_9PROT|nr:2-hydroxyacid dehydrogenase [Fodinicurvata sp. CAU 1616]MDF2094891.1 2-hydroxyacid dehydrogenase [Fodinicurvata sp. CAU 1616]